MAPGAGKSIPVVRNFDVESSQAPVTPLKETPPRPIYAVGQEIQINMVESEDSFSRFSQQREAQKTLSFSTDCAETSFCLPQRSGEPRRMAVPPTPCGSEDSGQNSCSCFNHCRQTYSRKLDKTSQHAGLQGQISDDPLVPYDDIPFTNMLLGLNQTPPSICGMPLENGGATGRAFVTDSNSVCDDNRFCFSSATSIRNSSGAALHQSSQQIHGNHTPEVQQCGIPNPERNSIDLNLPPGTQNSFSNGNRCILAPATPDHFRRLLGISSPSVRVSLCTDETVNGQNGEQENQTAAIWVDLQQLQKKQSTLLENHDPDKGTESCVDMNKMPQQKARRKKHRPKVVSEGKPKRCPKAWTQELTKPKETLGIKRKYGKMNKTNLPSTTPPAEPAKVLNPRAVKSCRKSLNFDLEGTAYTLTCTMNQLLKDYITLPQEETPSTPHLTKTIHNTSTYCQADSSVGKDDALWTKSSNTSSCASMNNRHKTKGSKRSYFGMVNGADENTHLKANHGAFCSPNHLFPGKWDTNRMANILFPIICKRKRTEKVQRKINLDCPRGTTLALKHYCCSTAPLLNTGASLNELAEAAAGHAENGVQFMHTWTEIKIFKKKRSKGPTRVRDLASLTRFVDHKVLPTFTGKQPTKYASKQKAVVVSSSPYSCMEALAAQSLGAQIKKKRSIKRNSFVSSLHKNHQSIRNSTGPLLALPWEEVDTVAKGIQQLNINRESSNVAFLEQNALIPYHGNRQIKANFSRGEKALVLYKRHGTIIPSEGTFGPVKRRHLRAKVDLDEETNRVWKLLLENIDNEGIDGEDEEKAKWWEDERAVFHGRVESFIARMCLVQGDRRFSPWKGSVVDSVIGVFLTQNVSDHLSSSAFMSFAARFPRKSQSQDKNYSEGAGSLVEEPDDSTLDLQGIEKWSGKMLDESICYSSRFLHDADPSEEKQVVCNKELLGRSPDVVSPKDDVCICINSCESSCQMPRELRAQGASSHMIDNERANTSEDTRTIDDTTSSKHYVLLSQTSANSPTDPTEGRQGLCSDCNSENQDLITNSKASYLECPASVAELSKIAEISLQHEASTHQSSHASSYQNLTSNQQRGREHGKRGRKELDALFPNSLEAPNISSDDPLHMITDALLQDAHFVEILDEENRSNDSALKDDNCTTEQSELTIESKIQFTLHETVSEQVPKTISSAENLYSCYILEEERVIMQSKGQVRDKLDISTSPAKGLESLMQKETNFPCRVTLCVTESNKASSNMTNHGHEDMRPDAGNDCASGEHSNMMSTNAAKQRRGKVGRRRQDASDWDSLRKEAEINGRRERTANTMDSLDYEAVRCAHVDKIADTIKERGMNNVLAERIKDFLNRLVSEHGSIDLEWLRDIPPDKAKEYLLSIRGLGLKSVECVRLLTLHHLAFPVDTNVGRIAVRLGWVPLQPLPESLQLHLLELYPVLESIQKYLWPRLCKLDQRTLYELHYHMITFGKVFCTKRQPNCNACPLRGECRHFASAFASARLALPGPEERSIVASAQCGVPHEDPQVTVNSFSLLWHPADQHSEAKLEISNCKPIVEVPASPEPEQMQTLERNIEDTFSEGPVEIPTFKLNTKQFTQTLQNYMRSNMELQQSVTSKALVNLTAEAASIPTPKLKNVSRLRTEHHVYELPDTHPLLVGLDKREYDDPCSYLLAIWTPGETANSIQPPENRCSSQEPDELCDEETCFYCNSQREANSQVVRGTLLIPCRTAMRGSFPLNGTYFQVNEVFADHDSSVKPMAVPRGWLWSLPRRIVYFGTSIPTIFRGLSTQDIQHCFWKGYVCVRGFDQKTRAPRPLMARLHFPPSKLTRAKVKEDDTKS
ncbi:hypothetical protein Nepgr_028165 [Nepenthes gracilis]|uniref:HhH-GPD domain-containing protein n=1 Tax=Nepenthes gracilis TaxID=150966 RepID=A0AAD3Y1V4_NEPGR|nr:hypothetical protein Nepgr_028165 [Nepenthes gracilis]